MSHESTVLLHIGAQHTQVRLARLVAAGVATQEGFDVEAVEDLRISVDEACVWLIGQGAGTPLALTFTVGADGRLAVSGETERGEATSEGTLGRLAAQILAASCAEYAFTFDGTTARFALVARPPSPEATEPPGSEGGA